MQGFACHHLVIAWVVGAIDDELGSVLGNLDRVLRLVQGAVSGPDHAIWVVLTGKTFIDYSIRCLTACFTEPDLLTRLICHCLELGGECGTRLMLLEASWLVARIFARSSARHKVLLLVLWEA